MRPDGDATDIVPFLAAGEVAWDTAVDGLAYAAGCRSINSSRKAPISRNCPWLDVTWEVTIVRCLELDDETGQIVGEQRGVHTVALCDLEQLVCRLGPLGEIYGGTNIGPHGGCLGSQVFVTIDMPAC